MKSLRELENQLLDHKIVGVLSTKAITRGLLVEELAAPRKRLFDRLHALVDSGDVVAVKNHYLKNLDGRCKAAGTKEYLFYAKGAEGAAVESILKSYPTPSGITSDTLKSIAHETTSYPPVLKNKLMEGISAYIGKPLPAAKPRDEKLARRHRGNTGPRDSYKHVTEEELDEEVLAIRYMLKRVPLSTEMKHLAYYIQKYHGTYGGLLEHLGLEPANRKA